MLVVRKASGEREKKKPKRLDAGPEIKAKEVDIACLPPVMLKKKSKWVKRELKKMRHNHRNLLVVRRKLKKMKHNHRSSLVGLRVKQKEMERVRGELSKKGVVIESFREAGKTRREAVMGREARQKKQRNAGGTKFV